jgi:hypothetical protein
MDTEQIDSLIIDKSTFYFDQISLSEYESIRYDGNKKIDTIIIDSSQIFINNDRIAIYPQKGHSVVFENDTSDNETRVVYKFIQVIKSCNLVQIEAIYYEWRRIILVSLNTGKQTELWDLPNFSPNKNYMISSSADLVSGEMPNGIQLFSIENNEIKLKFEVEIENWEPEEINWFNDSIIYIKRAKLDSSYNKTFDYVKTRIIK